MHILDRKVDLLLVRQQDPHRFPFLLESHADHDGRHRYDLLLEASPDYLELSNGGLVHGGSLGGLDRLSGSSSGGFLDTLERWFLNEQRASGRDPASPFHGGWFLYFGYELATEIEPGLRLPHSPDPLPTALAVRCRNAVVVDHLLGRTLVTGEDHGSPHLNELIEHVRAADSMVDVVGPATPNAPLVDHLRVEPDSKYLQSVHRIREYIAAGDVFQANISRRWEADLRVDTSLHALHRALRGHNPAPFSALMEWQGQAVVSSSPERLIRVSGGRNGIAETRPIAGTRPRGATARHDAELAKELLRHYKERAEHIMLIDLERNDLGRVCVPGSVEVDELMTLESYAHVHHIVSNVRGRLRDDMNPVRAAAAVFPGGTITGCPKVRCMEIIADLEQRGRGAYTGSLGYLDVCGHMDMNILIRSLVVANGTVAFNAGAGIVADSDPAAELIETGHKARGLLAALGVTHVDASMACE